MQRRSKMSRAVAVVAAVVLLAACGGANEKVSPSASETTAAPTADESPTTVGTEDEPAAPADSLVEQPDTSDQTADASSAPPAGTLRVGLATDLTTLDPHRAAIPQLHYLIPVYDSLTQIGTDGSIIPGLAASVESDDKVAWTITLQPDATFADGTSVDAAAVVASLERGRSIPESPSAGFFAQIVSTEAIDAATALVTLSAPSLGFARDVAGLPGMIVNPSAGSADLARQPAGAGPYDFDTATSVEGVEYHYLARDSYWGKGVGVAELVYGLFTDASARVNALRSGQIDIAAELGPDQQALIADDFEVVRSSETEPLYLGILDTEGTVSPALGDARVRQALSLAIDREGITQALYLGQGIPTTAFWVEGSPYYSAAADAVGYDPDQARQLLADAGYPDGFEFSVPTVEPLRAINEAVQASLSQIGVTMNVELQQAGTMGDQMRNGQWVGNITIARGYTAASFFDERLGTGSPFNPFQADNSSLDAMADAARSATDEAAANAAWAELYAAAVADGRLIVITQTATAAGVAGNVTGAQTPPGSLVPNVRNVRVDG